MVKISRFASTPTAWLKLRTHAPLGGSGTIQQPGASTCRLRSHYGPTTEGDRYLASLLCKIAAAWLFAMVLVLARNVTAAASSCISITSPSAGATVSSSSVAIATTDTCSGLWYENLYVDGTYTNSFAPGTVVLDSTIFSSGSHTIEVTSQSENPGSVTLGRASESLKINNSCISITSPSAGATASGSSVAIATTDTCSGLWYENLYVDGTYIKSFAPGTVVLDSTIFSSGSHTIEVTSQSENPGSVTLGSTSESLNIQNGVASRTPSPSPKPSPTSTAKPSPSPTPKPTPTVQNGTSSSPSAEPKPTSTPTPKPSSTPKPSPTPTPKPSSTATPKPTSTATPVPVSHLSNLPPGAVLPSESTCATLANQANFPETTLENVNDGTGWDANNQIWTTPSYFYANAGRDGLAPAADFTAVDGKYSGTSQDIIRWSACKWGVDEDWAYAETAEETGSWTNACAQMHGGSTCHEAGDCGNYDSDSGGETANLSFLGFAVTDSSAQFIGPNAYTGQSSDGSTCSSVWSSWSIIQSKARYFEWYTWPMLAISTAWGEDYRWAKYRACVNGDYATWFGDASDYLNAVSRALSNPNGLVPSGQAGPTNLFTNETNMQYVSLGCIATHYSGGWYDSGAVSYLTDSSSGFLYHLNGSVWPGGLR